jgi:hypothetical protein
MNASTLLHNLPRVAFAVVALGTATAYADAGPSTPAAPARVAVLAGADASPLAFDRAAERATTRAAVRHVGGLPEARAEAAALAAEGYDTVITVGAQARAAGAETAAGSPSQARFTAVR